MSVLRALFGKRMKRGQVWERTFMVTPFMKTHTIEILEVRDGFAQYRRSDSPALCEDPVRQLRYAYKYSHEVPIL